MSNTTGKWFEYKHLPLYLQPTSKLFFELKEELEKLPDSAEKSAGMRKLLEAKDCFVRVALEQHNAAPKE